MRIESYEEFCMESYSPEFLFLSTVLESNNIIQRGWQKIKDLVKKLIAWIKKIFVKIKGLFTKSTPSTSSIKVVTKSGDTTTIKSTTTKSSNSITKSTGHPVVSENKVATPKEVKEVLLKLNYAPETLEKLTNEIFSLKDEEIDKLQDKFESACSNNGKPDAEILDELTNEDFPSVERIIDKLIKEITREAKPAEYSIGVGELDSLVSIGDKLLHLYQSTLEDLGEMEDIIVEMEKIDAAEVDNMTTTECDEFKLTKRIISITVSISRKTVILANKLVPDFEKIKSAQLILKGK